MTISLGFHYRIKLIPTQSRGYSVLKAGFIQNALLVSISIYKEWLVGTSGFNRMIGGYILQHIHKTKLMYRILVNTINAKVNL